MKKYLGIAGILIVFSILTGCNKNVEYSSIDEMIESTAIKVADVSASELKAKLDEGEMMLLIDVREHSEHIYGFIPGAVNICRGVLEFRIGNEEFWDSQFLYLPEKNEEIIVYCKKGKRGVLAANSLKMLGYTNVKNLKGGWKEWEMNYPLLHEKSLEEASHGAVEEEGGC